MLCCVTTYCCVQEDYHGAISTCSEVLAEDKQNAKALFRRGRARHLLGQSEAALKDLVAARQAESQDAAIAKELAAVRKELKEVSEAVAWTACPSSTCCWHRDAA